MVFAHCNTVSEAMGCLYYYFPCQEVQHSLAEEDIEAATKKNRPDEKAVQQTKKYKVAEMWECEWLESPQDHKVITVWLLLNRPKRVCLTFIQSEF